MRTNKIEREEADVSLSTEELMIVKTALEEALDTSGLDTVTFARRSTLLGEARAVQTLLGQIGAILNQQTVLNNQSDLQEYRPHPIPAPTRKESYVLDGLNNSPDVAGVQLNEPPK
jgi:hypothetical protein